MSNFSKVPTKDTSEKTATSDDVTEEGGASSPSSNVVKGKEEVVEEEVVKEKRSLEDSAGILNFIFMIFMDPIFTKGYNEGITHTDLGVVSKQDEALGLYTRFHGHLETEIANVPAHKRSLWMVLWRTVSWSKVVFALGLFYLYSFLAFVPIIVLNTLVRHFEGTTTQESWVLWTMVASMFVLPFIGSVIAAHSNGMMAHIGVQIRNSLINAIYRKAIKLSPAAKQASSTGQIVNMFSSDTRQLQQFLFFVNNVAVAPLQILAALALVYQEVGVATFVGFALMFVIAPMNISFFTALASLRKKLMVLKDGRVKLMNEVLAGIRIIKYYAWELAFEDKVKVTRERELTVLKYIAYVVAIGFTIIFSSVPVVQPIIVFFTYIKLGFELTAAKAFTTIALFNAMQLPFIFMPMGIAQFSQSQVSCERMMKFFTADELTPYVHDGTDGYEPDGGEETVIEMKDADAYWMEFDDMQLENQTSIEVQAGNEKKLRTDPPEYVMGNHKMNDTLLNRPIEWRGDPPLNRSLHTLMGMDVRIKKGQLVAVVGSVGSGKSSFLSALLGEMSLRSGDVYMKGSVAYCNQQPWVLNDTLKGNVLFGEEYDEARFDRAIHAANMEDDIRILPGGVMTEIGEKGINLSGGQKARVQLARAVYRDADIYLMDDPLSAVDAHVGEHLFKECVKRELRGKTRILVTHHVHLLDQCDHIIILNEGTIKAQGTFKELQRSGVDISNYVEFKADTTDADAEETGRSSSVDGPVDARARALSNRGDKSSKMDTIKKEKAEERHLDNRTSKLTTLEERKLGDVTMDTYLYYLRAGGWYWFISGLLFQLCGQGFQVYASFILSDWGEAAVEKRDAGSELSASENLMYNNNYALFSMMVMVALSIKGLLIAQHRIGTSSILHDDLLRSITSAPVWFFDVTPIGRILNRFSSDMTVVDEELSQSINQIFNSFFGVLGAFAAVAAATKGTFMIVMIPLSYGYATVQKYFRKTNTTIARLEGISRSPIYADFSELLGGLDSVRAYKQAPRFIRRLEERVNSNTVAAMMQQLGGQWLAIRLDCLGSLISFFIALIAVATAPYNFIPAGYLALGLTYSFTITSFLKFCVRVMATGEAMMNSVERIMFYCEYVDSEEVFATNKESGELMILNGEEAEKVQGGTSEKQDGQGGKGDADIATVDGSLEDGGVGVDATQFYSGRITDAIGSDGVSLMSNTRAEIEELIGRERVKYANWPTEGKITFNNISMKYQTGPLVLKNLGEFPSTFFDIYIFATMMRSGCNESNYFALRKIFLLRIQPC
jgi:ABC-type multidrug transport system fused ATPase/permease subunit